MKPIATLRHLLRPWRRSIAVRPAPVLFTEWAQKDRDISMEAHHTPAVAEMLAAALSVLGSERPFTAIDAGCGNGWTVRRLRDTAGCVAATGVDASAGMIEKARSLDPHGDYVLADLMAWQPPRPVDLVVSMEVLYYLEDPLALLRHIATGWLTRDGCAVFGIDHYLENTPSLSWPADLHVHMTTWPESRWLRALAEAGFKPLRTWRAAAAPGAAGTLAMLVKHRLE